MKRGVLTTLTLRTTDTSHQSGKCDNLKYLQQYFRLGFSYLPTMNAGGSIRGSSLLAFRIDDLAGA